MIPACQTKLTPPDGDCFAACVASILELPLDEVPNPHGDGWWAAWQEFLSPRGLYFVNWQVQPEHTWRPPGWWIGTIDVGPWQHSCVYHGDEMAWNPHPGWTVDRTLALNRPLVEVTAFAAIDAATVARAAAALPVAA